MRSDRPSPRLRTRVTVLLGLLLAPVCAAAAGAPAAPRPVWPPPPDLARVEYVGQLTGPRDFTTGLWKRLSDFAAGAGSRDDLAKPTAIAVSPDGKRVYVLDAVRMAVLRFDLAARRVTSIAIAALPNGATSPFGLALGPNESLYVTDQASHSVVMVSGGRVALRFGHEQLARPVGCAVNATRKLLYVVDSPAGRESAHRVAVFDLGGRFVRWIGGRGTEPGRFNYPTYVTVDPAGDVYVVDTLNWRVQVFDADGRFVRAFGRHSDARGDFDRPKGVAIDRFGNVHVSDSSWDRVLIFSRWGRPLLDFGGRGTWPGGLQEPTAVAIGADDRVYVADTNGHRVNIYRLINTTAADTVATSGGAR